MAIMQHAAGARSQEPGGRSQIARLPAGPEKVESLFTRQSHSPDAG